MELPVLAAHPDCTTCSLHAGVRTVGMATRPWDGAAPTIAHRRAVLLIGKAPATEEDAAGRAFVGVTGYYTNELYVRGGKLDQQADVYLTNAARCRLPNPKMAVPLGMLKACRGHLESDVRAILAVGYDELVILATGAEALKSVCGRNVSLGSFDQGQFVEIAGHQVRVFATYLAAALLPGRDPSKAAVVEVHLGLLEEYLRTGELRMEVEVPEVNRTERLPSDARLVSLDIETYGAIEGRPTQRFFHPLKCLHWDGVSLDDLVVSAALAWRHPVSGELCHCYYALTDPVARDQFVEDLTALGHPVILGQNIVFDVMFLRMWEPRLRKLFEPFGRTQLVDLLVLNFLDCDQRPERSLKKISPLLRTYNYGAEEVSFKRGERFTGPDDPRLAHYNVVDAVATLRGYELFQEHIGTKYGPASNKGTPRCLQWYSDQLWLALQMSENGIRYDVGRLQRLHDRLTVLQSRIAARAAVRFEAVLSGEGSVAYQDDLAFRTCKELGLVGDRQLKLTEVGRKVSSGQENINLFLGVAQPGTPLRTELRCLRRFREISKTISSYTRPMLGILRPKTSPKVQARDLNNALVNGFAYPTWYVVPSQYSGGTAEESGGTQQARMTSKGPAVQTQPPSIEACQCSRFSGGAIVAVDESQIELRVAAMYSHDQPMIDDYLVLGTRVQKRDATGRLLKIRTEGAGNRHATTGALIAGHPVTKDANPKMYHAGKTLNFLTLFAGGPKKFQETVQREAELVIPLDRCKKIIADFDARHVQFRAWQAALVATAKRQGYVEIPVVGISRTFLGTPATIDATYVPTIANIPIQATAALLTISAQVAMERLNRAARRRALVTSNTYDESRYDCPPDEVEALALDLVSVFNVPPVYSEFVAAGLYPLPLDCEVSVTYYFVPTGASDDGQST